MPALWSVTVIRDLTEQRVEDGGIDRDDAIAPPGDRALLFQGAQGAAHGLAAVCSYLPPGSRKPR